MLLGGALGVLLLLHQVSDFVDDCRVLEELSKDVFILQLYTDSLLEDVVQLGQLGAQLSVRFSEL